MHDQIFDLSKRRDTLRHVLKNFESDKTILKENIFYNNQAYMEINDESCYEPKGNGTEVGLLKWLLNADYPISNSMQDRYKY